MVHLAGQLRAESPDVPAVPMSSNDIYRDLRERIRRGEAGYQAGDKLPTQAELAELYSVHRATISRAILLLSHEGLVVGRGGAGTYVADGPHS